MCPPKKGRSKSKCKSCVGRRKKRTTKASFLKAQTDMLRKMLPVMKTAVMTPDYKIN